MARPWRCVEDRRLEENPGKCDTLFDVNPACMVKYARAEVRNTFFLFGLANIWFGHSWLSFAARCSTTEWGWRWRGGQRRCLNNYHTWFQEMQISAIWYGIEQKVKIRCGRTLFQPKKKLFLLELATAPPHKQKHVRSGFTSAFGTGRRWACVINIQIWKSFLWKCKHTLLGHAC